MSTRTDYLDLVLPELNEFINSWNAPVNQNMESIDDFCSDLYESLVGSSATGTWSMLRGSLASLADRLDVSINADGTLDLSGSPDLLAIGSSSYYGEPGSPVDRLDDTDGLLYGASLPITGGRFSTSLPIGYPHADLDAGVAIRTASFGVSKEHIASPFQGSAWSPGLVDGGASNLMTPEATNRVKFNAGTTPAILNIDGYVFRLREDVVFDYASASFSAGDYLWFYVERVDANYNTANFKYGATPAARDLRVLQGNAIGGGTGSTSGSDFTAPTATFMNGGAAGGIARVREGDVLVITGAAAGDYVVDSVTNDTNLVIKGTFKTDVGGLTWSIRDNWHPNLGVVSVVDAAARPPLVAGRVYIGRGIHAASGGPTSLFNFTRGGVYDSGWVTATNPQTFDHELGALPSSVDVWVRVNDAGRVYRPVVRRQVLTNLTITGAFPVGGDRKYATMLFPSLYVHASEFNVTTALVNALTDPVVAEAYFTDSAGVDQPTAQIRIVARR